VLGLRRLRAPGSRDFFADSDLCLHGFFRFEFASDAIRACLALEEVVHPCTGSHRRPEHFNGMPELVAQGFHESVSGASGIDRKPAETSTGMRRRRYTVLG
jgi:hypothetical protein